MSYILASATMTNVIMFSGGPGVGERRKSLPAHAHRGVDRDFVWIRSWMGANVVLNEHNVVVYRTHHYNLVLIHVPKTWRIHREHIDDFRKSDISVYFKMYNSSTHAQ